MWTRVFLPWGGRPGMWPPGPVCPGNRSQSPWIPSSASNTSWSRSHWRAPCPLSPSKATEPPISSWSLDYPDKGHTSQITCSSTQLCDSLVSSRMGAEVIDSTPCVAFKRRGCALPAPSARIPPSRSRTRTQRLCLFDAGPGGRKPGPTCLGVMFQLGAAQA